MAYINNDPDYQLKIAIKLEDTRGKRIFKTKTNPFETQKQNLRSFTPNFDYKNVINQGKWKWKMEQDQLAEQKENEEAENKMTQQNVTDTQEKKSTKEWFDKHQDNLVAAMNIENNYDSETGAISGFELSQVWSGYDGLAKITFDKIPDFSIYYKIHVKFEDEKTIDTDQGASVSVEKYRLGDEKGAVLYEKGISNIDIYDSYVSNYIENYFAVINKLDTIEIFKPNKDQTNYLGNKNNSSRYYFHVN